MKNELSYEDAKNFANVWYKYKGSILKVSKHFNISQRNIFVKRRKVEEVLGINLESGFNYTKKNYPEYQNLIHQKNRKYSIVIGSDYHEVPGKRPKAFIAFLDFIKDVQPEVIIINGDWFDFPSISRHARIDWQKLPSVEDELIDGIARMEEIEKASPKSKRYFILGNHDLRFSGKLANSAHEFENIKGTKLEDHIPKWEIGISVVFNDCMIVMHRYHGGIHSSYNDVLKSGSNIVTGHDHKLNIRPYTDFNGIRYGIKSGVLSDIYSPVFSYMESKPRDWQPGFVYIHVDEQVIMPYCLPLVLDKNSKHLGKTFYCGKWYGK